jgi:protein-L-isoaspartate(D-aspartate) O-methyltransferase
MTRIQERKNSNLANEIDKVFPLSSIIFNAFKQINREVFVPNGLSGHAYSLNALPISGKQFISSPLTVAKMTHYLELDGVDSILEVGCGSGYQASILSCIVRRVFTIERIEKLLQEAKNSFKILDLDNIHTRLGDGQYGWPQYAQYDRIIFSAAASFIPKPIGEQLKENGILIAPMDIDGKQIITKFIKKGNKLIKKELEVCEFVPIVDGTISQDFKT